MATRVDNISGNYIGKAEDPTVDFLIYALNLKEKRIKDLKEQKPGIYRQVPLVELLHPVYIEDLAEHHKKGSVDIVLVIKNKVYAIRVQGDGHYGDFKSKRDSVQKHMLVESGINVIDIWKHECKELFKKDKLTSRSISEIIDSIEYQAPKIISKNIKKKILKRLKI